MEIRDYFHKNKNYNLILKGDYKMPAVVDKSSCTGCEACVSVCPTEAIVMEDSKANVTDDCIDCGACVDECPVDAISMS